MTPREIRTSMNLLREQERLEVEEVAKDIREKYHKLREEVKAKCTHNWQIDFNCGVCPWDTWYRCSTCGGSQYGKDEKIYNSYKQSNPELFEDDE